MDRLKRKSPQPSLPSAPVYIRMHGVFVKTVKNLIKLGRFSGSRGRTDFVDFCIHWLKFILTYEMCATWLKGGFVCHYM